MICWWSTEPASCMCGRLVGVSCPVCRAAPVAVAVVVRFHPSQFLDAAFRDEFAEELAVVQQAAEAFSKVGGEVVGWGTMEAHCTCWQA